MIGYQNEVPPNTLAGAPLDEWDRMQLIANLNRLRRERARNASGATALAAARIYDHIESDSSHLEPAEGEQ